MDWIGLTHLITCVSSAQCVWQRCVYQDVGSNTDLQPGRLLFVLFFLEEGEKQTGESVGIQSKRKQKRKKVSYSELIWLQQTCTVGAEILKHT